MVMVLALFAIIFPLSEEYPYLKYIFLVLLVFVPRDSEILEKGIIDAVVKRYPIFKYYLFFYMFFIAVWVFTSLKEPVLLTQAEMIENHEYLWVMTGLIIPSLFAAQVYKYEKAGNK